MKILGKAEKLLCDRTNMRAKRRLRRCTSDQYKKVWQDLQPGAVFSTFFGAYLGVAFLAVGERHLEKKSPRWISQQGEGRIFEKIAGNLFRLLNAHFVAHTHKDTVLFKRSIREQRIRFYGNEELSHIVYGNSIESREPPNTFSGDETVTRCYTKKATDIRMRTSKKNESGILNQSLCGSNEGYGSWKQGDPKASGFTFNSSSYPGANYNVGSVFREKDMGNLLQLVFSSRDYFRFKNLELITDSHFGHITPIIYSRFYKLYVTSSFTISQRIVISNIEELSREKLEESKRKVLIEKLQREGDDEVKNPDEKELALLRSDVSDYCKQKPKKMNLHGLKTQLDFFERSFRKTEKGTYSVWRATAKPLPTVEIPIYLHAVNDSKPVYRITNRYASLPAVKMRVTELNTETRKKELVEKKTSAAHRCFRFNMGFNDGSDRLRSRIGLSGKYYRSWPKHLVAKTLEDGIINAYANYLLDTNCKVEPFTVFMIMLVDELLESGKNLRSRKSKANHRRSYRRGSKRPVPGSDEALIRGSKCRANSFGSILELPKADRSRKCQFCGRQHARYKCRTCKAHLCMTKPKETVVKYRANGPCCFVRYHGFPSFPRST